MRNTAPDIEHIIPGYRRVVEEFEGLHSWARQGLPAEERTICAVACLALDGRPERLVRITELALDLGITARGIVEVILQAGIYGGFPMVEEAVTRLNPVFEERGLTVATDSLPDEDDVTVALAAQDFQNSLNRQPDPL